MEGLLDYTKLNQYEWILLGVVLTMPVSGAWHLARKLLYGPTQYEIAENYINIMKMAVENSSMTAVQQRNFWNNAVTRLSNQFSVGATPSDPIELVKQSNEKDTS
jgi:hypothetical protein